MIRGPFLGSCHLGICLPESRTCYAAAPQSLSKHTSALVVRLQALRDKDVIESVPQAAGIECSGAVANIKSRQRIAVDQGAVILEEPFEIPRLSAVDGWSFV